MFGRLSTADRLAVAMEEIGRLRARVAEQDAIIEAQKSSAGSALSARKKSKDRERVLRAAASLRRQLHLPEAEVLHV